MKYRVVGWTYYDSYDVLSSGDRIGFAERNAIIDEIRKHKYLFTGYDHQESFDTVPVLNDGRARLFSQRGWGGVMAEAYGHMGDYDYASFTFSHSLKESAKKYPSDSYDPDSFEVETVENENFEIEVSEELFSIAETKNPFYLCDLDELRFIDEDDLLTLKCKEKSLTFLVKDIDRNSTKLNFKDYHLIDTKYKIIVTHKPLNEKKRKPLKISTRYQAKEIFDNCIKEYDYETLYLLFNEFNLSFFDKKRTKNVIKTLTRFVKEYSKDTFISSRMIEILKFINDFELFKEIAYEVKSKDSTIMFEFVGCYLDSKFNLDKEIIEACKLVKSRGYYGLKILRKGIELDNTKKIYRKKYYNATYNSRDYNGLLLIMDLELFNYVRPKDKYLLNLNDYSNFTSSQVFKLAEILSYQVYDVRKDDKFPYSLPEYYRLDFKYAYNGIIKYKEYINKNFNLEEIYEKILLHGIEKSGIDADKYFNGYRHLAEYIYALDAFSSFRYNLKEKAVLKYKDIYPEVLLELEDLY